MDDKRFTQYVMDAKEYNYTLKIAADEIDNSMIDKIEYCLEKYQLVSASAFKKTPIQESPLDFPNVKNYAVNISELVMSYPATPSFLEKFISNKLGISEQQIVVYSENDPRRFETELHLERSSPEYKENYKSVLGEDEYSPDSVPGMDLQAQADNLKSELASEDRNSKSFYKWEMNETGNSAIGVDNIDQGDTLPEDYDKFIEQAPKESFSLFGRMKKTESK